MADGMSLDEYVKETLLGIVKAVMAAQEDAEAGGYIGRAAYSAEVTKDEAQNAITDVAFDLATTVEEKGGAGGGVGVKVIPFMRAEVKGHIEGSQSTVSRIGFKVPVAIPRPKAQKAEDAARRAERDARHQRDSAALRALGRGLS